MKNKTKKSMRTIAKIIAKNYSQSIRRKIIIRIRFRLIWNKRSMIIKDSNALKVLQIQQLIKKKIIVQLNYK
jgi:hypothetical protein